MLLKKRQLGLVLGIFLLCFLLNTFKSLRFSNWNSLEFFRKEQASTNKAIPYSLYEAKHKDSSFKIERVSKVQKVKTKKISQSRTTEPRLGNGYSLQETNQAENDNLIGTVVKTNKIIVEPKGWSYNGPGIARCKVRTLGCFQPTPQEESKSMSSGVIKFQNLTHSKCIDHCKSRSIRSIVNIGLRNGDGCICAYYFAYSNQLDDSKCNVPCGGDITRTCGGLNDVTMVYQVASNCRRVKSLSDVVSAYFKLGCFPKPPIPLGSVMEEYQMKTSNLTTRCLLFCERVGLVLAIPRYPNLCYCGHVTKSFNFSNSLNKTLCEDNNGNYIDVYRTMIEDRRCGKRRFLHDGELKKKIGLFTFPGSGNTWLRYLIESATGIFTGSVYRDTALQNGGFMGEVLFPKSSKVAVIKSHRRSDIKNLKNLDGIINVYRDPYDALLAEFTRKSKGHTGVLKEKYFKRIEFQRFATFQSVQWRMTTESIIESKIPSMIFSFEDLKKNTTHYTEKMARFIMGDALNETDLQNRLLCLSLDTAGNFKRKKGPLGFDPFNPKTNNIINEQINLLGASLNHTETGPISQYRRPLG